MRVMVGCEFSGTVRRAFRNLGHDAWSCDLLPSEDNSEFHIQGDVMSLLDDGWDLGIFHPPCTHLAVSGARHFKEKIADGRQQSALEFVRALMTAKIERICIENPVSIISSRLRKPDQVIQPYWFGCDASKATCLWLKNLPVLRPTRYVSPRVVNGKHRWSNQDDNGQNNIKPSPDRWKLRSKTYEGIGQAMADQWSQPSLIQSSLF